jgi:hypothetical protein
MRGSMAELMKNRGYGCILGEDGCVVYFDEKALDDERSGMFQPLDLFEEGMTLTERDKEFLCSLRVRF